MSGALDKVFRGIQIFIAILLAIMIVLVFMNVVMRYLFHTGFAWSEEIARLAFIYLVYLGTIDAYRDNRHLGVDLLIQRVPDKAKRIVYIAIQLIVIWMMAVLAAGSWALAYQSRFDTWVATGVPWLIVHGAGVVTGISIIFLAASNIYRLVVKKEDPLELMKSEEDEEFDFSQAEGD